MKLSTRLALFRPGRLVLITLVFLIYVPILAKLFPLEGYREGALRFLATLVLIPLLLGRAFTLILHSIWHRPSSATTPQSDRLLWTTAVPALTLLALVAVGISRRAGVDIAWGPAGALALAFATITLPWEKGLRWNGALLPSVALWIGLLLVVLMPLPVMQWTRDHPGMATLLGAGITALSLRCTARRQRMRVRATQLISVGFDPFDSDVRQEAWKRFWTRKRSHESRWPHQKITSSMAQWSRAIRFEVWGFEGGLLKLLSRRLLAVFGLVVGIEISQKIRAQGPWSFTERCEYFYAQLWSGDQAGGGLILIVVSIMLLFSAFIPLPRPDKLYPLSRHRRAQLVVRMFCYQSFVFLAGFLGLTVLFGFTCGIIRGQPVAGSPPMIMVITMACYPLVVMFSWFRYLILRKTLVWKVFIFIVSLSALLGIIALGFNLRFAFSFPGIASTLGLLGVFHLLFVYEVRRFYRVGDLSGQVGFDSSSLFLPRLRG